MVVPNRHINDITELSGDELNENGSLVSKSVGILRENFNPEGFNIGLNIGKAGGAGIDEHLHMHVVPRWAGDDVKMNWGIQPGDMDAIGKLAEEIRQNVD